MGKLILILGGARSGKSTAAEQLARQIAGNRVLYVATAEGKDNEMRERIAAHQKQRPTSWRTLEVPLSVADSIREMSALNTEADVVLLDCVTLLASNILLTLPEDCTQLEANQSILNEVEALLLLIKAQPTTWIIVSNEVGMGVVPPSRLGRLYQDALGQANQRVAQDADEVILMVAGLPWKLKPI